MNAFAESLSLLKSLRAVGPDQQCNADSAQRQLLAPLCNTQLEEGFNTPINIVSNPAGFGAAMRLATQSRHTDL